jgi:hypothetical protein
MGNWLVILRTVSLYGELQTSDNLQSKCLIVLPAEDFGKREEVQESESPEEVSMPTTEVDKKVLLRVELDRPENLP